MLTDAELTAAHQLSKRYGSPNCWTGGAGTLASYTFRLVRMVRDLQEAAVKDPNHPGYGADPVTPAEALLVEAQAVVRQRRSTYGPPTEHFARTVAAINAILGHKLREPLTVSDWAQIMILDKLARNQGRPKRDNQVDCAGYAACWAEAESRCSTE